jgi:hypothetical protein
LVVVVGVVGVVVSGCFSILAGSALEIADKA